LVVVLNQPSHSRERKTRWEYCRKHAFKYRMGAVEQLNALLYERWSHTWVAVAIAGVPSTGETGWGWAYYLSDTSLRPIGLAKELSTSITILRDFIAPRWWIELVASSLRSDRSFLRFQCLPNIGSRSSGHLFFTSGPQGGDPHPVASPFMRSTDGGTTWTTIPNVLEVRVFGFGNR